MSVTFGMMLDGVRSLSVDVVRLAYANPALARQYVAEQVRRYRELRGAGLPARDPIEYLYEQGCMRPPPDTFVHIPLALHGGGGTALDELLVLGMTARLLRPAKVFEIGTFMGRTTSVLAVNSPPGSPVVTLDLPPEVEPRALAGVLDSDAVLIRRRSVGAIVRELGLTDRCRQLHGDSLTFDPAPHRASVELGFIDGAHSRQHVENDTAKMAEMMAERGIVFWHDYGGRGRFRELTEYLDALAATIRIYRVPRTTLAWAPASEVRKLARP